jgi:hypothetical protein
MRVLAYAVSLDPEFKPPWQDELTFAPQFAPKAQAEARMNGLSPETLQLLDFLCSCKLAGVRVSRLRTFALAGRLESLRYAGLVQRDDHEPTPWAMDDWLRRRDRAPTDPECLTETQAGSPETSEPAEPPEPGAAEEEGGAARSAALWSGRSAARKRRGVGRGARSIHRQAQSFENGGVAAPVQQQRWHLTFATYRHSTAGQYREDPGIPGCRAAGSITIAEPAG